MYLLRKNTIIQKYSYIWSFTDVIVKTIKIINKQSALKVFHGAQLIACINNVEVVQLVFIPHVKFALQLQYNVSCLSNTA